jgi:hypothetical protein
MNGLMKYPYLCSPNTAKLPMTITSNSRYQKPGSKAWFAAMLEKMRVTTP